MGQFLAGFTVFSALLAGGAMYYLQVYAFYEEVSAQGEDIRIVSLMSGEPESILFENFQAIDGSSSPIRYRACFTTEMSHALLTETYVAFEKAEPRNAPGWFDCFDAEAIGAELEAGTALTFLSQKNFAYGVDRVVAITEDGRGYVWHELNDCGAKAYDGSPTGEACPPREDVEGQN
ncbi:MAG: histidine kinase [Rhodobacteraceae bacterium]|nr:histidine kinase [Paracoccaceae bacterium]